MLSFVYNYVEDKRFVDLRDINMRKREGILFNVYKLDHFKRRQDPFLRAIKAWNDLPVHIRNADSKETLITDKKSIINPYKKIY